MNLKRESLKTRIVAEKRPRTRLAKNALVTVASHPHARLRGSVTRLSRSRRRTGPHLGLTTELDDELARLPHPPRQLHSIPYTLLNLYRRVMSPPSSPTIVRAPRVYGRPRPRSDHDSSYEAANSSIDSRDDSSFLHSTSVDFDHPPTSDPPDASNASPISEHASDDEGPIPRNRSYAYGWRRQLDAIDDAYTNDVVKPTGKPLQSAMDVSATRTTSPSDRDHGTRDVSGGSLSSLTNSSPPGPSVAPSLTRPRSKATPASYYESDHDDRPSTPQSPTHTFGTPKSRSSPTPPTSIEMPPKNGKGKGRSLEPLHYDSDHQSVGGFALTKARNDKGQKKSGTQDKRARIKVSTWFPYSRSSSILNISSVSSGPRRRRWRKRRRPLHGSLPSNKPLLRLHLRRTSILCRSFRNGKFYCSFCHYA